MKMSYQKFYSNQIHSSSLLCQLSQMWKDQMLCDALIRTGPITTKAHRLVLIAACPMLQSMENAAAGSHLEVRLAADIKQEAVNTFLQYLYEGFMMLTEENCRDVEKVARLLQVDGVIKCCADFYKCYQTKTGVVMQSGAQYKYSFQDLIEFRHVRSSDMLKSSHDRLLKRSSEFPRPVSPGGKRQRMHRPGSPPLEGIGPRSGDMLSMSDSYRTHHPDPWERVPRQGAHKGSAGRSSQPGVIDIVEDSIEIVQSDTVEKDPSRPIEQQRVTSQRSVAISIASQITDNNDLRIVNITGGGGTKDGTGSRPSVTTMSSSSKSQLSSSTHPEHFHQQSSPQSSSVPSPSTSSPRMPSFSRQQEIQQRAQEFNIPNLGSDVELVPVPKPRAPPEGPSSAGPSPRQQPFPVSISPVGYPPTSIPPKSFGQSQFPSAAAGSATQIMGSPQSIPSPSSRGPRSQSLSSQGRSDSTERASPANEGGKEQSGRDKPDSSSSSTGNGTPDLSIVKIEKSAAKEEDSSGLEMYVDMGENSTMTLHHEPPGEGEEGDRSEEDHDEALEEWAREEMTNDGSNVSGDPSSFGGSFKGTPLPFPMEQSLVPSPSVGSHRPVRNEGYKYKCCVLCQINKVKTRSGWRVYTHFKCEKCDVPLCVRERNCFRDYHMKAFDDRNISLPPLSSSSSTRTPKRDIDIYSRQKQEQYRHVSGTGESTHSVQLMPSFPFSNYPSPVNSHGESEQPMFPRNFPGYILDGDIKDSDGAEYNIADDSINRQNVP